MKSSSNSADQNTNQFPVDDWLPNDFLNHSLVDLTPAASKKSAPGDPKGKKVLNLKEALALLQPSLVKLPIVDSPRYKKVLQEEDGGDLIKVWQPLDLSSPTPVQLISQASINETAPEVSEPSGTEIANRTEILSEIDQKIAQANADLDEAQQRADEIIIQANAEAVKIKAETQALVDQIRQNAYEEGLLAAQTQVEKQVEQITVMIKETQTWRSQILEHSEPTIIRMVQTISKKLFGAGFVLDASYIEQMVGRAINEANRLGNLRIYVNPEDHALLLSLWQESDLVVSGQKILLIPSQNIIRGGCFVEGEFGSVDSRIDMQLERLEKELNNTLSNREQEKQRQMEFSQIEKISQHNAMLPPANLEALDQFQMNVRADKTYFETPQEINGFNNQSQPE